MHKFPGLSTNFLVSYSQLTAMPHEGKMPSSSKPRHRGPALHETIMSHVKLPALRLSIIVSTLIVCSNIQKLNVTFVNQCLEAVNIMNSCWGLLWTVPLGKGKELMLPTNVFSQVPCPKCPWATKKTRAALEKGEVERKSPAKTVHSTRWHLLRDFNSTDSTRFWNLSAVLLRLHPACFAEGLSWRILQSNSKPCLLPLYRCYIAATPELVISTNVVHRRGWGMTCRGLAVGNLNPVQVELL